MRSLDLQLFQKRTRDVDLRHCREVGPNHHGAGQIVSRLLLEPSKVTWDENRRSMNPWTGRRSAADVDTHRLPLDPVVVIKSEAWMQNHPLCPSLNRIYIHSTKRKETVGSSFRHVPLLLTASFTRVFMLILLVMFVFRCGQYCEDDDAAHASHHCYETQSDPGDEGRNARILDRFENAHDDRSDVHQRALQQSHWSHGR